jgi:hypothetical protein
VTGRASGSLTFAGTGAGSNPTASSVVGDVVAVLRRIAAGRHAGVATGDAQLAPVRGDTLDAAIPLRRVVRLASLGDVRPAREALAANGIHAEPLDGLPAILTLPLDGPAAEALHALLVSGDVRAESAIPLWEDITVAPLTQTP